MLKELAEALTGESAHAAPACILESLTAELAHRAVQGAPHTVYQELWHIAFWQQISLDWIEGIETPYPLRTSDAFPDDAQTAVEPWAKLCQRFLNGSDRAAALAADGTLLPKIIRCPSRPGQPVRQ